MEALRQIGCEVSEAVFLDDIGINLKVPRAMGIRTIQVQNTSKGFYLAALEELQGMVGVDLFLGKARQARL